MLIRAVVKGLVWAWGPQQQGLCSWERAQTWHLKG